MKTFPYNRNDAAPRAEPSFAQKVALVVGAGQSAPEKSDLVGNGRAISVSLARRGARVVCADRDIGAAQVTLEAIHSEGGVGWAIAGDIAVPGEAVEIVERSFSLADRLDALVLNAGISDRKRLPDVTVESWEAIFDVNLRGHMLCAQRALNRLTQGGAIVFISSIAAYMPAGRNPAYETSKAALIALCRAVAFEGHVRNLRANVVVAGLIDTAMGRAASRARPARASGPLPFGRQGSAWEVANAAIFLLSDDASYINATELIVDGGFSRGIVR